MMLFIRTRLAAPPVPPFGLSDKRNHYEILGVSKNADDEAVRRAFRNLSKSLHPDTTKLPAEKASIKFHSLCESYATLSDPERRSRYDKFLSKETEIINNQDSVITSRIIHRRVGTVGYLRPLSNGEWFSLLLLGITFFISLMLVILIAVSQGMELRQPAPSWLVMDKASELRPISMDTNVVITTRRNSIESSLH